MGGAGKGSPQVLINNTRESVRWSAGPKAYQHNNRLAGLELGNLLARSHSQRIIPNSRIMGDILKRQQCNHHYKREARGRGRGWHLLISSPNRMGRSGGNPGTSRCCLVRSRTTLRSRFKIGNHGLQLPRRSLMSIYLEPRNPTYN